MAVLDIYTHPEWLAEPEDDDAPIWPVETLTAASGVIWWSAALDLDTDD